MMRLIVVGGIVSFLLLGITRSEAQNQWPKEIPLKNGGKVVLYQTQPETISGNTVTGRAAISVKSNSTAEPIFGALFYTTVMSTNKDTRMADMESLKITNVKFPGTNDTTKINKLITLIETEVPKWKLEFSIDEIITSVNLEKSNQGSDQFKNDAPKIYYRNKPTTLILLDGEPKIQKDKDMDAERVINSPYLIFKEESQWNMYTGGVWYKSASVTEGWTQNTSTSKKVKAIDEQIKKHEKENNKNPSTAKPIVTDILVTTEPAELLQTKGEPEYKTITGTSLLYVSNTPDDIFKDINTQITYVLLAGRWYATSKLEGPYEYVAADKLPADFAKIPEGNEKDAVLASVAGTPAAEEAKIDAAIPQTAKVDKKTAKVEVKYDGSPKFKAIDGTSLQLAENSDITVMKDADGKYFALDNGVWFTSKDANGPWAVSDERPKDVDKIPPSNEAYNTKYVYVYENTPDYVYMGYTPGYMGCYVYGPTVVYGTGFYYAPWYGSVYYPCPVTWGFGFHYNPYTGWGMSVGFNVGFMTVSVGFGGYGGWYGPPYYRPPYYRPPYGGGGYYGNRPVHHGNTNINIDNSVNIGNNNNIYRDKPGVSTKDVNRGASTSNRMANNKANTGAANKAKPSQQPNNVYADRNGNAYMKDNKGNWNQRNNQSNQWAPATRDNVSSNNLQRESANRDRSANRQYNSSRNMGGGAASRGAGAARGGGGGGRRR